MRLASLTVATALSPSTVSMTTAGMAFGNHGGRGGNQFVHRARRVHAIAARRHLPSPQKAEALGKLRS
jgi:hypothetical protein